MAADNSHLYVYAGGDGKAGMGNVDQQKRVIGQLSSGSAYLQHAQEVHEAGTERKVAALQAKLSAMTSAQLRTSASRAAQRIDELEQSRSFARHVVCLDMDMFYAQVELLTRPELADRPVGVGGTAKGGGVLTTCNYVARSFGCRSAMPTFMALKLCPQLVLLPCDFAKYEKVRGGVWGVWGGVYGV